ncbi:OLC1v1023583C1 [Oldenlandia corymbosa var. corymbosa]|uniref:Hexosyltransferase n=1 Tax=Oldenlandia corymbosa var. corymbosa TaxID=529605 RepID=A0AAV1C0C2_OLDCO|nr:OLC1v1023583C1 [Oldenlandia corymbosa var. corymbosa]
MKFYISTSGIKRVTIGDGGGGGGGAGVVNMKGGGGKGGLPVGRTRRGGGLYHHRTVLLPVVLMLGLLLPFLFVRIAFIVLESASVCSSSLDCMGWRIFGGNNAALLREELTRALLETTYTDGQNHQIGEQLPEDPTLLPASFVDLVKDVTSNKHDIKTFAFKAKAMLAKLEQMVQSARNQEKINWHLASHGIPKSHECLSLMLAEEYAVNAMARSRLPSPEFVSRLNDPSFHHLVLLTDNVIAASVVISSAVKNSASPEKLVFHVVTDKKTYTAMHAWFAVNSINSAVVEVRGLHQYDWSHRVNVGIREMLEIHHLIWRHKYVNLKEEKFEDQQELDKNLEVLSPSFISLLNHLRIYIPELFPDLDKIVFLDDDIVVQHDLSSLWDLDLNGKVIGAVVDSWCGHDCCPRRKYKDFFNFTIPVISSNLDGNRCAWLYGMNIIDLQAWRKTNITATYHHWLKLNLNSGFTLWHPGALPPALLAFDGHMQRIESSWHMAELGRRSPQIDRYMLEAAAVIHFSGPAKPWLEIASPEVRSFWYKHVNYSNEYIRKCGIMG